MKGVFGGLLMAAGILIAGLSGLCTLLVVGGSLADTTSGEMGSMVMAVGIFGGIPFLIGLGLFLAGRSLIRSGRSADIPPARGPVSADGFARPRSDREAELPPE